MTWPRGLTEINGNFKTQSRLVSADVKQNSLAFIDGDPFTIDSSDKGSGVLLANGLFANPILTSQADIPNNQTGTAYTLVLTDQSKTVWMNNAAANILTIPTNASIAFLVNTTIMIMMEGAGFTTLTADTGVTLNGISAGSGTIGARYSGVTIVKRATNTWVVTGDIGTIA